MSWGWPSEGVGKTFTWSTYQAWLRTLQVPTHDKPLVGILLFSSFYRWGYPGTAVTWLVQGHPAEKGQSHNTNSSAYEHFSKQGCDAVPREWAQLKKTREARMEPGVEDDLVRGTENSSEGGRIRDRHVKRPRKKFPGGSSLLAQWCWEVGRMRTKNWPLGTIVTLGKSHFRGVFGAKPDWKGFKRWWAEGR